METATTAFSSIVVAGDPGNVFSAKLAEAGVEHRVASAAELLADAGQPPDEIIVVNQDARTAGRLKRQFPACQVVACTGGRGGVVPELTVYRGGDDADTWGFGADWPTFIKLISQPLVAKPKLFVPVPPVDGRFRPASHRAVPDQLQFEREELFEQLLSVDRAYAAWHLAWLQEVSRKEFTCRFRFGRQKGTVRRLTIRQSQDYRYMGVDIFSLEDPVTFHGSSGPRSATVVEANEETISFSLDERVDRREAASFRFFNRETRTKIVAAQLRTCDELSAGQLPTDAAPLAVLAGRAPNSGHEPLAEIHLTIRERRILRDDAQARALLEATGPSRVSVIRGPGGSGKTSVLAVLAKQFQLRGDLVLVVAHSNQALDVDLDAVADSVGDDTVVFRLGNGADSVTPLGLPLHRSVRFGEDGADDGSRPAGHNLNPEPSAILRHIIAGRGVVLGVTMSSFPIDETLAQLLGELGPDFRFDVLLVDEATRGHLRELAPILCLVKRKAVLIGDHRQLGNIRIAKQATEALAAQGWAAALRDLQRGLFHSLVHHQLLPAVLLNRNRRSLRKLTELASQLFYAGELEVGRGKPDDEGRLTFLDTSQAADAHDQRVRTSFRNQREASLAAAEVLKTIRRWLAAEKVDQRQATSEQIAKMLGRIGIIAPYLAQLEAIRQALREALKFGWMRHEGHLRQVCADEAVLAEAVRAVGTVDAFQGSERDAIIVSFTCSNDEGRIGFNEDIRRLVVALTRARDELTVIGNAQTFLSPTLDRAQETPERDEVRQAMAALLGYVQENGRYRLVR